MPNWMEEIFKDLQASLHENTTKSIWVNVTETKFDLKTKLMNVLTANGKHTVSVVNRRERLLIRKLLWMTGLWKLDLPETKETLDLIYFLKNMESQQYTKNISNESEIQNEKKTIKPKVETEVTFHDKFKKVNVLNKSKYSTL